MRTSFDTMMAFLNSYQEGQIILNHGKHERKIQTRARPNLVFIGEVPGDQPVCQGGLNAFSMTYLPDGFVLYADVKTEDTEIYWEALLAPRDDSGVV